MKFWDCSAIIPLCVEEELSSSMRELLRKDELMVVWWGTIVECNSALSRLVRANILSEDELMKVRKPLLTLKNAWAEILPGNDVREQALRIINLHGLKAADSWQLSSALIWADHKPVDSTFVTLDTRLKSAAQKEGFSVWP